MLSTLSSVKFRVGCSTHLADLSLSSQHVYLDLSTDAISVLGVPPQVCGGTRTCFRPANNSGHSRASDAAWQGRLGGWATPGHTTVPPTHTIASAGALPGQPIRRLSATVRPGRCSAHTPGGASHSQLATTSTQHSVARRKSTSVTAGMVDSAPSSTQPGQSGRMQPHALPGHTGPKRIPSTAQPTAALRRPGKRSQASSALAQPPISFRQPDTRSSVSEDIPADLSARLPKRRKRPKILSMQSQ